MEAPLLLKLKIKKLISNFFLLSFHWKYRLQFNFSKFRKIESPTFFFHATKDSHPDSKPVNIIYTVQKKRGLCKKLHFSYIFMEKENSGRFFHFEAFRLKKKMSANLFFLKSVQTLCALFFQPWSLNLGSFFFFFHLLLQRKSAGKCSTSARIMFSMVEIPLTNMILQPTH